MTQNCAFVFGYTNIVVNGMIILIILLNFVVHKFRQLQEAEYVEHTNKLLSLSIHGLCSQFSLDQMQRATSNFCDELVIGKGGFGKVYRGSFGVGPSVFAIKRLQSMSSQGSTEFLTEIEMLTKLQHSHLVPLVGYCDEGNEMILVYEYMPGGTLADHLYKRFRNGDISLPPLSWIQRIKICIGAARGLDYLHTGTGIQHRVIHRDVKTTNILLDENLAAKISDFGLSKIGPANQAETFVSTRVKVLLEALCGRPAFDRTLDEEQMGLAGWAQHCFKEGLLDQIIDHRITEPAHHDSLEVFVDVAIKCLHYQPKHRPTMAEVVVRLESALALQEKSMEYVLAEIVTSDYDQEDIDLSNTEVENENSEKEMADVSNARHDDKQSSGKMTIRKKISVFLSHTALVLSATSRLRPRSEGSKSRIDSSKTEKIYASGCTLLKGEESSVVASPRITGITVDKYVEFSYDELSKATNDFNISYKIGQGGFGAVYYAELRGEKAAIKKMDMQASREFLAELKVLTNVHHLNLVRLIGYCVNGSLFLVYEYIENGNVSEHLRGSGRAPLSWSTRVQIALDSARGLEYIHEHTVPVYIHRDIKSANILIDKNYRGKVADFGLTNLTEVGSTSMPTGLVGTFGYMPPEYAQYGDVSPKVDVYAFGVVLYELISAKDAIVRPNDSAAKSKGLIATFEEAFNQPDPVEGLNKLVDPRLGDDHPIDSIRKLAQLAKACTHENPQLRPSMRSIVVALMTLSSSTGDWDIGSFYENHDMVNLMSGR